MPRIATVPITMGASGAATLALDDFLVTAAGFPASERLPPHVHERASLAVMLEGSFDLTMLHRVFACEPGSCVTEPAQERHGNNLGTGGAQVVVIQPDPVAVSGGGLGSCGRLFEEVYHVPHSPGAGVARRIARELRAPDAVTPLAVEGLVLELLALCARQDRLDAVPRRTPRWLTHAREELNARFRDPPRVHELARAAGVHPDHLARAFRARFGIPIGAYVRRLRLDWATRLLESAEHAIAWVALEAGFADQSHFTRAFKRHTGLTPAEYRAMFGDGTRTPSN